jgi:hypothetical protein
MIFWRKSILSASRKSQAEDILQPINDTLPQSYGLTIRHYVRYVLDEAKLSGSRAE